MTGDHQHGLRYQAQPLLLHHRGGDGKGLPGPDRVRHVGAAGGDHSPDHPLLVLVEPDDVAGTRQGQVAAVEMARHQIVETVVVEARQPVGAVGIGPDPVGEAVLDPGQLLLGGLGGLDVEDALFGAVFPNGIVDLWGGAVQRIVQQVAGVAPGGAPFGGAGGGAAEPSGVHVPGRQGLAVQHRRLGAHDLLGESLDHIGRNPRRAEARGDVGRA